MAIRYDRKFNNEINRIVKNYNAKVRRLEKSGKGNLAPSKINSEALKSLKASVNTRKDLRRRLKDLEEFSKRGGEKFINVRGKTIQKYKYANIKRYQRLIKVQTTRKLNYFKRTKTRHSGREEAYTIADFREESYLNEIARREYFTSKRIEDMSSLEQERFLEKIKRNTRTREDNFSKNFLDMLEDSALIYGYDQDKLEAIIDRLKGLSSEEFNDLYNRERNIQQILFHYKAIDNISTYQDLVDNTSKVIDNFDELYYNLDIILEYYE